MRWVPKVAPAWELRAEFWVEGVGEDYGTDTTEAGTYLYLTTDQVRFYQLGAAMNYAHAGGGGYVAGAYGQGAPAEPESSEPSASGRKKWVPKKKD